MPFGTRSILKRNLDGILLKLLHSVVEGKQLFCIVWVVAPKILLSDIKWMPARGNGKWFLPTMTMSFPSSAKEVKKSREHKVKGFANNLTLINTNPEDHQQILTYVNSRCLDLGLTIRPDKCYSVVFNGKKVLEHLPFAVGPGQTRDIRKFSTTFLGSTVSHSFHQSMIQASEPSPRDSGLFWAV